MDGVERKEEREDDEEGSEVAASEAPAPVGCYEHHFENIAVRLLWFGRMWKCVKGRTLDMHVEDLAGLEVKCFVSSRNI